MGIKDTAHTDWSIVMQRLGVSSCCAALSLAAMLGTARAADAPAAATVEIEEVLVTGSLIQSPNQVAASPIVVTTAKDIQESGAVTLEAALNQLPQFAPSGGEGTGGQGGGAHATVNLHGLGPNRNLVLLDGRRLPLADISGNVDINLVPESILSSVETVTGGASAVYGSDAMSGVVNFKSLKNFEGIAADLSYGNSSKTDLRRASASVAMGTSLGGERGHALLSLSYTDRQGFHGYQRPGFFGLITPSSFIGQGTFVPSATNAPSQAVVNALFSGYNPALAPVPNVGFNLGFNDDGTLFTQTGAKNYKGPTTGLYGIIGGNVRMPVGMQAQYLNPLDRKSAYVKFDYELTPAVTSYGQVLFVDSTTNTASGGSLTQFGNLTTIPTTNPFIPADLRTLLASRPNPTAAFTWNGRYVGLPDKAWDENYTTSQFLGGLKGDLPLKNWKWDVFGAYDTTEHLQSNYNAVLKSKVQQLLNAADGGNSICAGGFNPFGLIHSSQVSQACRNFMTTTAHSTERLTQTNLQGTIQGTLFALPAGDVQAAVLADYRRNTYVYSPDAALAAQDIEAVIAASPSQGKIAVHEYAGQLEVPLLADKAFARKLSLGMAYRNSKYSTSGGVNSYEADLKWAPTDGLLVRAGYQRAVRAPNIGELFAAPTGNQVGFGTPPASIGDPCDIRSSARTGANAAAVRTLCLAQGIPTAVIDSYTFPTTATAGVQAGNPNLTPETADTFNYGFTWKSRSSGLFSDFNVSVDFYNISIKQVISVVPGVTSLSKCYNLDGSNPTLTQSNAFCQLLHRDASGLLQLIETPYFNLGGLKTKGVDVQLDWSVPMAQLGMSRASGKAFFNTGLGYLQSFNVQTLPNTPFQDFVGTNTIQNGITAGPHPKYKALTGIGYENDHLTAGVRWRYMNAMEDIGVINNPTAPRPQGVLAYNLFDLYGNYNLSDRWQLRAGITNLKDRQPPVVASSQVGTDPGTFDIVGRQYYVGVHLKL
jgi:outer membrane receptor protein involved in Fe transport